MSLTIKIISGIVITMNGALFIASVFQQVALIFAVLLGLLTLGCYLRAPVAYNLFDKCLTVRFRVGHKHFGKILKVSRIEDDPSWSIRIFGNGGLFAGTGFFWNGKWGIFRAYVTTSKPSNLLLLETESGKILISPSNTTALLECI
jgi:hypothetical protein